MKYEIVNSGLRHVSVPLVTSGHPVARVLPLLIQNPKSKIQNRQAFSLTEVLIAIAILSIALVMVGVSFPVGVLMTTNVAERTTASVVADEAFAKIRLYGVNTAAPAWNTPIVAAGTTSVCRQEWLPLRSVSPIPTDEFLYPSDDSVADRVYSWAALCRREVDSSGTPTGRVRVVVFVSRRGGPASRYPTAYPKPDPARTPPVLITDSTWFNSLPMPTLIFQDRNADGAFDKTPTPADSLLLSSSGNTGSILTVSNVTTAVDMAPYLDIVGSWLLDDDTGELYRVVSRVDYPTTPVTRKLTLDRALARKAAESDTGLAAGYRYGYKFWVVPAAVGSGKNPCIAVYQKVIDF